MSEVRALPHRHPSIHPTSAVRQRRVARGRGGLGKDSQGVFSPAARSPASRSGARGSGCLCGSGTRPSLPVSFPVQKGGPQRRGALRRPREAGVAGVQPPAPLPRGAEGGRRGAGGAPGADPPGPERPWPTRAAPGRAWRALASRGAARATAAAALASGAPCGPALELQPGQPAPARARPVSAGPAPPSWLGSAPGSRPAGGAAGPGRRPGSRGAAPSAGAGGAGRQQNEFDTPQTCAGRGSARAAAQAGAKRGRRGVHRALCAATNVQLFQVTGFCRAGYVRGGS